MNRIAPFFNSLTLRGILVLLVMTTGACGRPPKGEGRGEVVTTSGNDIIPPVEFRVETVAGGLNVPWDLKFAPDGRIFFTERPGRLRVIVEGRLREEPVATLDDVESRQETGLMGLVLHPDFAANGVLYMAYAYAADGTKVRVVRYRESGNKLTDRRTIIEGIPAARFHAGCRLSFGPDRKLYITTGDATEPELAQQLGSLAGKTLRLNDDGSLPPDNPFAGRSGARPEIWSYGHRNSQGLAWQPGRGLMFQTEHGPSGSDGPGGGDEVNIIQRGRNYGWPVVHHSESREGMESPILEYTPAVAPGGCTFYQGTTFPQLSGNFLFACLRGECIIRVVLDEWKVLSQERWFAGKYGRIRDVAEGPDGTIYFTTSNRDGRGTPAREDDRILRLVPAR